MSFALAELRALIEARAARRKGNGHAAEDAKVVAEARPELAAAVEPLLKAREAIGQQIAHLDRKVMRHTRRVGRCPLSGVKRTWLRDDAVSAYDPKRTWTGLKSGSAAVSCTAECAMLPKHGRH